MNLPYLVFSDTEGNIQKHPYLRMAASSLNKLLLPKKSELIKIPKGSTFFYLPFRHPVGFNFNTEKFEVLKNFQGKKTLAVGAFSIPGFLRLHNPASISYKKKTLPLWAYTACGFYKGSFYIAAKRIDNRVRQSPYFYDNLSIKKHTKSFLASSCKNRLYKHLANCALNYNCLAAKNLFLERWEAPLPTSRFCNAKCIGCLSHQESDCVSSHARISFKPRVSEVVEVMRNHLETAREAIVSFGQGCEGEPLLEADLIAESVSKVREVLRRGTINVNTNASLPKKVKLLCEAGVDSFRVSLNSIQKKFYDIYFKPLNYSFLDVLKSIEIAKKHNKFVSINLFVFPGFSDSNLEIKTLIKFIKNTGIDMIQWRNLNIDPDYYLEKIFSKSLKPQGVLELIRTVKKEFPTLKTGYFNLPKESFKKNTR